MSAEQVENIILETPSIESKIKKVHDRVDINKLMLKVREEQKKQNTRNLVTFGVFLTSVVLMGIFISM
tara:strand:+ start:336 stop:539 length:204 start_codon:yes stop_codon:yes gene_type:complete